MKTQMTNTQMTNSYNIENIKPITAIGRTFYLLLPVNLRDSDLEIVIFNLEKNLKLKQKIRILTDNLEQMEKVETLLKNLQTKMKSENISSNSENNLEIEKENQTQNLANSIVNSSPKSEKILDQKLENLEPQNQTINPFEFKLYKTNFFQLETSQIPQKISQNPAINWQIYAQNGFEYSQVSPNLDNKKNEDFQIAMNFFLTSFGSNFSRNYEGKLILIPNLEEQQEIEKLVINACQNPANKIFLVKKVSLENEKNSENSEIKSQIQSEKNDSENTEFVGAFSFLEIGNEIQLHYTAGKTTLLNDFKGKKLPILTAAMLDILQNSDYQEIKKLTFSNKDETVSKAYESNGFELFENRKCLLLKSE